MFSQLEENMIVNRSREERKHGTGVHVRFMFRSQETPITTLCCRRTNLTLAPL